MRWKEDKCLPSTKKKFASSCAGDEDRSQSDSESREPAREQENKRRDKGPVVSARDRKLGPDNFERTSTSRSERARESLAESQT